MNTNLIAFFIGLFGSIHCVGMCGPLALAVPSLHTKGWLIIRDKVFYNAGRVITYSFLGLLIGLIGKQLWLYGLQQGISLLTGFLIIMAGLSRLFKIRLSNSKTFSVMLSPVNRLLNYALRHKAGHLIIGLLNGLLPCGFVYLALAGAVNTSSPLAAGQYMFWFGMGTFPLMLLATVSSGFMGPIVRRHINKAMPYLMICLGFWFVVRGMHLNISYLSPAAQAFGVSECK
jgi:sulfite exporter TauE/SafE